MYYSSNKNNSSYYNAYKEEMESLEDYNNNFSFQTIIKIAFIILSIGLFTVSTIYLVNHFSTDSKESIITQDIQKKEMSRVVLLKENLPKSIQFQEPKKSSDVKTVQISPKEVALIVEIILTQIHHKEKVPLERELLEAETDRIDTKTLKEINHYNKVVIETSNKSKNLIYSNLLKEENPSSNYEEALKKELDVRSNEMRIIVVQGGDTLSKIAKRAYGDRDAYPKIFKANPEVLKNPNQIFVGQKLRIPA